MQSKFLGAAVLGLLFCAGAALAEEYKGKITKVDAENNKITVSVDGKETEYAVASDCKFPKPPARGKDKDKEKGKDRDFDLKAMSKQLERGKDKDKAKEGIPVVVTTTKKDDKEVVSEIKLDMRKGKDKKDKDAK